MDQNVVNKTARRCAERGVVIPTFSQLKDPQTIPASIQTRLAKVGMNEIDPVNLFRITWKNQPAPKALLGVSFSPSTMTPITATVTSSQLTMIA